MKKGAIERVFHLPLPISSPYVSTSRGHDLFNLMLLTQNVDIDSTYLRGSNRPVKCFPHDFFCEENVANTM